MSQSRDEAYFEVISIGRSTNPCRRGRPECSITQNREFGDELKVGERTFLVTSTTRISKAGQPATFADATVGEEVGGQYKAGTGDKLELLSLRIGPRPDKSAAPTDGKKKP